jgi:exonuclease III
MERYVFFRGNKSNKEGVAFLLKNNCNVKILNKEELIIGRLIALEVTINEKAFTMLNIYGPNDDNINIFQMLEDFILENDYNDFIIGGDFNTVIYTNIDKKNWKPQTRRKCRDKIKSILETCSLCDIWRI